MLISVSVEFEIDIVCAASELWKQFGFYFYID